MEQQLQQPDPAQALSSSEPKLAALLIDPVDSGRGAQEHDTQYPSAAQALAGKIRSAAIVGAWLVRLDLQCLGRARPAHMPTWCSTT